jgi:hypothetical protein
MPQMNNLVLKDRAATPADHTFKPRDVTGGVATLVESAGIPMGESRITLSQNRSANGRVRVVIKLAIPVVQDATVNGVTRPTIVRTSYADVTFNFDGSSSLRERQDLIEFVNGITDDANSMCQSYIADLEGLY